MQFKIWLEELNVRLNRMRFPEGPEGDVEYEKELDFLKELMRDKNNRQEISKKPISEYFTLNCYSGLPDHRLHNMIVTSDFQGMIWFTHDLQRGWAYDVEPKNYAKHHATLRSERGYVLTYPLKCNRSYIEIKYNDGTIHKELPPEKPEMGEGPITAINGSIYELPTGWVFTHQIQKHIGHQGNLTVRPDMLEEIILPR